MTDLGGGALGWTVAMVGWDFSYYWHHRIEHESRLLWACHVNHHSSRYYNLSTALRQPWTPVAAVLFYPWWALVGVEPRMIMIAAGLNLISHYWIHTETIDRMPRWFEAVFNTPSHHRVHHGSNAEYLDRNYGGILIVWDRCFRSFEPERAPRDLRPHEEPRDVLAHVGSRSTSTPPSRATSRRRWPGRPSGHPPGTDPPGARRRCGGERR